MKYGDDLDRLPADAGVSRRQFLAVGRLHAARLAAGIVLPGGGKRLIDTPTEPATPDPDHAAAEGR
jgi:hypothetical protein